MMYTARFNRLGLVVIAWLLMTSDLKAQLAAGVVSPQDTDPAINTHNNVHTWALPFSHTRRNKLFVFLPGTGGIPFVYQQIVRAAAKNGFNAVGLMYPNSTSVNEVCAYKFDPVCHENTRMEIIDGTNRTPLITVTRANSIENRLIKLLVHLHSNDDAYGWGDYLDGQTNLVWSDIVIAGHSQGGSHAALIAKTRLVHRCLMFASMDWRIPENQPPGWVGTPGLTPPERYFGLGHYDDPTVSSNRIVINWNALELDTFAPEQLVDQSVAPYEGSHMLMTDLPSTNQHGCMIADQAMITNNQGSVYLPVWHWMMTGPTVLPDLNTTSHTAITVEVRSDWSYQVQHSTNMMHFENTGSPITNQTGTVQFAIDATTGRTYRVTVAY
jgi:hypothetical protein